MSINSVALSGHLGGDPDVRVSSAGTSILSFSLAVSERVRRGDDWEDHTNWVGVVVFGRRAESLGQILRKGTKVAVHGHLRYSSWEKDGQRRSKLEVIADDVDLMQRRQDADSGQFRGNSGNYSQPHANGANSGFSGAQDDFYDESMPFS